jgi:hypothetical protein
MVRTAAVVGTANAVGARGAQRNQAAAEQARLAQVGAEAQQQAAIEAAVAQQVAAQAPAAPPPGAPVLTDDVVEQLKRLAELRDAGVLSEEEFAAQKARFLG